MTIIFHRDACNFSNWNCLTQFFTGFCTCGTRSKRFYYVNTLSSPMLWGKCEGREVDRGHDYNYHHSCPHCYILIRQSNLNRGVSPFVVYGTV
jgi:hypothetical protein